MMRGIAGLIDWEEQEQQFATVMEDAAGENRVRRDGDSAKRNGGGML
jgi:hypothetical protein